MEFYKFLVNVKSFNQTAGRKKKVVYRAKVKIKKLEQELYLKKQKKKLTISGFVKSLTFNTPNSRKILALNVQPVP